MTTSATVAGLAIAAAAALALAGCSESVAKNPPPPRASETSARDTPTKPTAPPIAHPLGLDDYISKPCDLLREADLALFDLGPDIRQKARDEQSPIVKCISDGVPSAGWVHLRIYVNSPLGSPLVDAYRSNQDAPSFKPLTIKGMPAAQYGSTSGGKTCAVAVGTSEDQGFTVTYDPGQQAPADGIAATCEKSAKAAETVLEKLSA
ncbi:DUF3558 family protein [Actinokineospora xionganensis]|uniref:DUF3558 domain-containing protein n=1 Tax=Actinokineospora xionganensis TaxID=2684470 RepID=A0ABR7LG93_9PSEU|nr:DUF3558 family protein [Actinokineospora xionganensis]MBC6451689.1 DUF3558 domain-containing protein [Actinokineospora xionganensis]